ncbi:MAG: hypothetical protein KAR17_08945, partial [Cyclobacteriaceae bacterium]|nr:hypothetical protein [Cyclobacteriaceae bacterium]
MIRILFSVIFIFLFSNPAISQEKLTNDQKIRVDSIRIKKNWRTKDSIIRDELKFEAGDSISHGVLDTMVIRLWNIGNFAKVGYDLDTLTNGNYLLEITAKDALTIVPILSFNGNRQDWSLSMGMSDKNFLGRNINFN